MERAAGLTAKGRFPEVAAEQPDCKTKTGVWVRAEVLNYQSVGWILEFICRGSGVGQGLHLVPWQH